MDFDPHVPVYLKWPYLFGVVSDLLPGLAERAGFHPSASGKLAHLIHLEINSNNIRYVIASLTSSAKPREFRQSNSHRDIVAVRSNQVGSMER
jgi:hypothetical protein